MKKIFSKKTLAVALIGTLAANSINYLTNDQVTSGEAKEAELTDEGDAIMQEAAWPYVAGVTAYRAYRAYKAYQRGRRRQGNSPRRRGGQTPANPGSEISLSIDQKMDSKIASLDK